MRKIVVVTGTRAEYGPLKPLMKAIEKDKELELIPLITGMHLLSEYGNTYKIVQKEFPQSKIIQMPLEGDTLKDMVLYLSYGIKNFAIYFSKNPPDIVIVIGDRSEQLAAALAAFYLNIPIAHINGGDVSGGMIDESIRHAITKISHMHLAYTKKNAERIKKLGEDENRIHVIGNIAIEAILDTKIKSKNELFELYNLNPNNTTFLVVQHPITTIKDKGLNQFRNLLLALDKLQEHIIIIYPNCDSGSKELITLLNKYKKRSYFHMFKNIPHEDYVGFMKYVNVMIGNSSSGILEAPAFKTPFINIGDRQQGRDKQDNVIDIEPKKDKILEALHFILNDTSFKNKMKKSKNLRKINSSKKIVFILKKVKINEKLIRKQITY